MRIPETTLIAMSMVTSEPRVASFDEEATHVALMHEKFDLGYRTTPGFTEIQPLSERVACLQEELTELTDAVACKDLPGIADALVDLVVFAKGTAVQLGLPWAELFDDVMRSNMSKVRGVGKRGHAVDLVKPDGWIGPRTEEVLAKYGWVKP